MSIDKQILFSMIESKVKKSSLWGESFKEDLLWVCNKVIFHDPTSNYFQKSPNQVSARVPKHKSLLFTEKGKGLPIGNHTSQFFANVYLNELDQFIKNTLKCKNYIRYVDDFILLSNNKDELLKWFWEIRAFVRETLLLNLKPEVTLLPLNNGIDFLGYIIRPWSIFIRRRVLSNFKNKLITADTELTKMKQFFFEENSTERKHFQSTFSSYLGHFKHANSNKIKKQTIENFKFTKLCFNCRVP
ncbi:MAG: RNA-directed DNA polymerase [archaeon]